MEISLKKTPKIRISYDEMEAYLLLPTPLLDDSYALSDVMEAIEAAGIKYGVNEAKISSMLEEKNYDNECLIAKGINAIDGVDASFEFSFDTNFSKKPTHREDGSVDYWSIHLVETVEEGQIIATYHEPVDGSNGMTVKGKVLTAKRARPLPPLAGKGFTRSEDNKTYTADMTGKIEMQGNRILISQVHEIFGDVGLKTGNIDFHGDVLIHGNVPTGAIIKATGSVTIDGTVEAALIEASKDVIIRGGMLGKGKGMITTKGNLHAKFLEYSIIKAEGDIVTDSLMNCNVTSNGMILLKGKHASIVGGVIYAAIGVEAYNFGNEYGVKTEVYTGVNMKVNKEMTQYEENIKEAQDTLEKIDIGLKQLEELAKTGAIDSKNDPRKATLLRTKIVKQADLAANTQQLEYISKIVARARNASVKVFQNIYAGVTIGIHDAVLHVQDYQQTVVYHERNGRIIMFSMREEMVE